MLLPFFIVNDEEEVDPDLQQKLEIGVGGVSPVVGVQ